MEGLLSTGPTPSSLQLNVKIDGLTDAVCPIMHSMENGKRMTYFEAKEN